MCSKVRPKLLIFPAAGKDCLFVSHRLCQTQAPFAKTEQISTRTGPAETLTNPSPSKTVAIRGGWGGRAHCQPLCRAPARRGGQGDGKSGGVATSLTSRPLERKRPGWERKRRRRKGWVRGRVWGAAEEEPGPSRRCAGVSRAKKGKGGGGNGSLRTDARLLSVSAQRCAREGEANREA